MDTNENFIEIDEHKLDDACATQSKHYMEWALKLADAQFNVDEAKASLELIEVELARAIRDAPQNFGVKKVTEKSIEEAVKTSESYQKKLKILHKKQRAAGRIKAIVGALDHRKKMIESMVYLRGQMYFSDPQPEKIPSKVKEQSRFKNTKTRK